MVSKKLQGNRPSFGVVGALENDGVWIASRNGSKMFISEQASRLCYRGRRIRNGTGGFDYSRTLRTSHNSHRFQ